jgi:carbon monoxide dehydrogenase subunit G
MSTYAHTVEIGRPPEEVFAFVTEPANYPRWQPSLLEVRPHSHGPLRVGSEATEVRRFLGRELETTWTCVEHEPSRRSAIESDDGPVPFRGTFLLEPAGGGTRFTWTVETRGAASRLGGPLVGRATRRELETNADRLKRLLEGARAACPDG